MFYLNQVPSKCSSQKYFIHLYLVVYLFIYLFILSAKNSIASFGFYFDIKITMVCKTLTVEETRQNTWRFFQFERARLRGSSLSAAGALSACLLQNSLIPRATLQQAPAVSGRVIRTFAACSLTKWQIYTAGTLWNSSWSPRQLWTLNFVFRIYCRQRQTGLVS